MTVTASSVSRTLWQCLSGDTKPTDSRVSTNDYLFLTDTGQYFIARVDAGVVSWNTISIGGGGAVNNVAQGQYFTLQPQSQTGANANNAGAYFSLSSTTFPPEVFDDSVVTIGYNVESSGVKNPAIDPWGSALFFENDYNNGPITTGTATGGTTTTVLTDSGKSFKTNELVNWCLANTTRGIQKIITANTATTITTAAIAGQVSGDTYAINRRDGEHYFQMMVDNRQQGGTSARGLRYFAYIFDKGTAIAQLEPLTVSSITNASPAVVTTSSNHGMGVGGGLGTFPYVKFSSVSGGSWNAAINNRQFEATVLSATTFSIPIDGTALGSLSAATVVREPPVVTSTMSMSGGGGWQLNLPSYSPTTNDLVLWVRWGNMQLFGKPSADNVFSMVPYDTRNNPRLDFYASSSVLSGQLTSVNGGRLVFTSFDTAGANNTNLIDVQRTAITIGGTLTNPTFAFLGTGAVTIGSSVSTFQSASAAAITNGSTITTAATGVARVAPGGAVTGIIMQAGTRAGQECTVVNESAAVNTATMAASGTSNVANGVTTVIAGLTSRRFVWDSVTALWYTT